VVATLSNAADPDHHLDIEHSRGQIVHRQIWTTDAAGIDFPGIAKVFRIRRDVFDLSGARLSKEIVHGITSLTEAAAAIARWVRQHWGVENKIHWVRDVVFAEDHQNAYLGAAAHGMALFRNLAIALIRLAGRTHIKRTLEQIAADRLRILPLLAASHPRPPRLCLRPVLKGDRIAADVLERAGSNPVPGCRRVVFAGGAQARHLDAIR
jgi:hypothetical protein